MSADASVRPAVVADADAVGALQALVWQHAYDGVVPPQVHALFAPASFAQGWRASLADPPPGVHRLLLAREGERVVGFVAIGPSQDPDAGGAAAEITALGVDPRARRRGHGSRLVNAAVDLLREAGADEVCAWVLLRHEEVRAFLAAAGLTPDGARRDRVVSPDGASAREVRLVASLRPTDEADPRAGEGGEVRPPEAQ